MDFESFCFWLRGFYEINGETALTEEQSRIISKHLTLVFMEEARNLPTLSEKALIAARRKEVMYATLGASSRSINKTNGIAHEGVEPPTPFDGEDTMGLSPGEAMESEDFKETNADAEAVNSSKIDDLVDDYHKAMKGLNEKVNTSTCSGFQGLRPTVSCMNHRRYC